MFIAIGSVYFRLVLLLCVITLVSGQTTPSPSSFQSRKNGPIIMQCFYEGRWFPAGTIISAGRSVNWCYGTYCDIDGVVKHWDNYNCPLPDQNNPQPPFPNIQQTTTTTTTPLPPTTAQPSFWFPTTQTAFSNLGCFYEGRFYWAGRDIYNKKRGPRCMGAYCDWNSRIQVWQDDCRFTMPPSPHQVNTPIDRT